MPTIAVVALLLLAIQWAGGAWKAEFDGFPDEPAQFVSGRMVWEYLTNLPREKPIAWAGQYYLHYPKVGIGHWPPGYYAAEASWSLIFGSSRISAMGLQWFLGLAALTGLYTLARPRFPLAVTWGIVLFAMITPVFQTGLEQTMAELLCLLCSVLFMHAMLRLLRKPDEISAVLVMLTLLAAAMAKGTAVCLTPVPFVALLASGTRPQLRSRWVIAVAVVISVVCLAWYFSTSNVLHWSGIADGTPWPAPNLGVMAGWGFLGIAVLGLRREPLPVIAGSMIGCAAVVSFAIRAMNDPRHWIIILPAILLLAGNAVTKVDRRFAALVAAPAILLFPYSWYRQTPAGFRELIGQLHLPARMLVSSPASGREGGWIAEVSTCERYPASFIVRASKALADSGWNGEDYKLLTANPAETARKLDELALSVVVIDTPGAQQPPHHPILAATMSGNPAWKICGRTANQVAYCRVEAPRVPRKPLVLDVGGWHLVERLDGRP